MWKANEYLTNNCELINWKREKSNIKNVSVHLFLLSTMMASGAGIEAFKLSKEQ